MKGYKVVRKINGKLFSAHAGQEWNTEGKQVRYRRDEVTVSPKNTQGLAVYLDGEAGLNEAKNMIRFQLDSAENLQIHRCHFIPTHIEGRYLRENGIKHATTAFSVVLGKKV